jgi:hypothetical protein
MWLQTDGQAKMAYAFADETHSLCINEERSPKLKLNHVKVAKVSSNVSERQQLFKGKLTN